MDKNEVKEWAGVVTAVLGAVFLVEKVIDKACCLFSRFNGGKKSLRRETEMDDDMRTTIT